MEFSTLNGYKVKDKKAIRFYDTVDDMINDSTLKEGMHVKTKGYYTANDGGSSHYHITATESNSDYQEELDNGLYATLIIDNVNIKQLGAKGDGITDDTEIFKKFNSLSIPKIIIPEGNYKLTDILEFTNKEIIGIGNPTLKITAQTTEREHFIKFSGDIKVENITFEQLIATTKTIGLFNCTSAIIRDCKTKLGSNLTSGSELDLYTNNKNILIENCIFDFKSYSDETNGYGGIWIRENDATKVSKNITFNNCYISHYSLDECLAIWDWNGLVENVQINNCVLEGKENNPSAHFTRFSAKNSSMNNCIFINKPGIQKASIIHNGSNDSEIVYVNNCLFDLDITLLNGITDSQRIKVNNCTINNAQLTKFADCEIKNTTINTPGFKLDNVIFKNNIINITNNFTFSSSGIIQYGTNLENCVFNNLAFNNDNIINNTSDNGIYRIINCEFNGDFTGLTRFMSSAKVVEVYIVNSILPKANFNLSNENNTGYIANNLIGGAIGYPTGLKTNNNFNYNAE